VPDSVYKGKDQDRTWTSLKTVLKFKDKDNSWIQTLLGMMVIYGRVGLIAPKKIAITLMILAMSLWVPFGIVNS
jgi:hypothetical protein